MKKLMMFLAVVVAAVALWSCDKDSSEEPVAYDNLPVAAKTFLSTYYNGVNILSLTKDTDYDHVVTFEAKLADGTEVDFNASGEWTSVDAADHMIIPEGIAPAQIVTITTERAPMFGINSISKEKYGYEVELTNGLEMKFDHNFNVIGHYDW